MLKNFIIECVVLLWFICALQSCASTSELDKYGKEAIILTGTMYYNDIEGGCWQFVADDGNNYEVMGVGVTPLLQNGLRSEIIVRIIPNVSSVCMVGKIVELLEIIEIFNQ